MKGRFLGVIAVLTILFSFGFNEASAQRYDSRYKHKSELRHHKKRYHHPKHLHARRPVGYHGVRGRHLSYRERRAIERHHKIAIREHKRALKHSKNIRRMHVYGHVGH